MVKEKFNREERILVYRVALLLRLITGWGRRKIARVVKELYKISLDTAVLEKLIDRYMWRGCRPKGYTPSAFERSVFFNKIRETVFLIHKEHPEWSYKRVAREANIRLRYLPISMGKSTAWSLLQRPTRERELPLRINTNTDWRKIAYILGVCIGDMERSNEYLSVKDHEFIQYVSGVLSELTAKERRPLYDRKKGMYRLHIGAWARDAFSTGIWKVIAYVFSTEFLQGFFDAEGYVSPSIARERIATIVIGASGRDAEVMHFVEKLLRESGFHPRFYKSVNRGKPLYSVILRGFYQAQRFAERIGFRVSYRRHRLQFLLSLKELPQRERYVKWKQWKEKLKPN